MSQTGNQASGDRRPIAARQIPVFAAMAAALARWRVRPNLISIFGMLAAIVAGVCLALTNRHFRELTDGLISPGSLPERSLFFLAAGLVQLRLLANMLDGMVAVEGNMRSPTGDIYNEAPDRISDVAVLVGAGYAVNSLPALGYLAAVGAVLVAYARALGRGTGHPADFRGPMAKQQRMFIITVASLMLAFAPLPLRHLFTFRLPLVEYPITLMSLALLIIFLGCAVTFWRRLRLLADRLRAGPSSATPPPSPMSPTSPGGAAA